MENTNSDFQKRVMRQIHELGETLERAGNTVSGKGWETIGSAIHKLGDTLEHLRIDRDNKIHKDADKSAGSNSKLNEMPVGASRTDSFSDTSTTGSSVTRKNAPSSTVNSANSAPKTKKSNDSTGATLGNVSANGDSLQSKSTQPKASDSQAY